MTTLFVWSVITHTCIKWQFFRGAVQTQQTNSLKLTTVIKYYSMCITCRNARDSGLTPTQFRKQLFQQDISSQSFFFMVPVAECHSCWHKQRGGEAWKGMVISLKNSCDPSNSTGAGKHRMIQACCKHLLKLTHSDFWSYIKESFVLALHSSSHHWKYFMSTQRFGCFRKAIEFTNIRYLQMDLTETNRAALHSSHILAVIHQMDEHHYRRKGN